MISLVDWTLAIIDPLKSSGLSPVSVCPLETRFASYSVSCKKKKNYYFVQLVQQELIFANEIAKSSCIYVYIYTYIKKIWSMIEFDERRRPMKETRSFSR